MYIYRERDMRSSTCYTAVYHTASYQIGTYQSPYPIPSHPTLSHPIPSCPVLSHPTLPYPETYHTIPYHTIPYGFVCATVWFVRLRPMHVFMHLPVVHACTLITDRCSSRADARSVTVRGVAILGRGGADGGEKKGRQHSAEGDKWDQH